MQHASPSVISPVRRGRPSALRGAFALLLAVSVGFVLDAATVSVPAHAQPTKKDDKDKDKEKDPPRTPEPKWPTDINGKDLKAVLKDLKDPDPVNREFAARTLPNFGPAARKSEVSKLLVERMTAEKDPTVRFAIYGAVGSIPFESENDNTAAIQALIAVVDSSQSSSNTRLQAVQTISMFGPRGAGAIRALTGQAVSDPSYETRRTIAGALGRIGFDETTGPNMLALTALADKFAKDPSAAVRMEALQALLLLGPPWAAVKKAGMKEQPPIKTKDAEVIIGYMKARVGDPKAKPPTKGFEKDAQVEIWARLVLMRFDPKEVNEENLDAFAHHLTGNNIGVQVQALQAIGMMGETGGKKVDAVSRLLTVKNQPTQLLVVTVQTLASMGAGAKPAIKELKQLATDAKKEIDVLKAEEKKIGLELLTLKDEKKKEAEDKLRGTEYERKTGEELVKLIESVIKHIDEAKPMSPSEKKP